MMYIIYYVVLIFEEPVNDPHPHKKQVNMSGLFYAN